VRLLLDTSTFLWLINDAPSLSERARDGIVDAENEVFLSPVSAWEIAVKSALGKLPLPRSADRLVPEERQRHAIESLALDEDSVLQLGRLPRLHRDPFDRMLVCQAIAHGLVIVTGDPLVAQYPVRTMW
jgi:PIN domain nuclease of toxin-antitoxin system